MSWWSIARLAWWDSSGSRRRLLLLMSAVIVGIASFVGIGSFAENLRSAMDDQAKTLLGSDVMFSRRQRFTPEVEKLLESVGGERRMEVSFTSMAVFPSGESRLAYVSAIEPGFPFFGTVETNPPHVFHTLSNSPQAFVDQLLMEQFKLSVGDSIRVGEQHFVVLGSLDRIPGETVFREIVAPRIYISYRYLEETKLLQHGSRVSYRYHYRLLDPQTFTDNIATLQQSLTSEGVSVETAQDRKKNFGQTLENTYRLLSFVWCLTLVLAGLGVASGTRLYMAGRFDTIAVLRCLGARVPQIVGIFVIQLLLSAGIASAVGALAGVALQYSMPRLFQDALPVSVQVKPQWSFVLSGIVLGLGTGLLFALEPVARIRKVSPLSVFRREDAAFQSSDSWTRVLWLLVALVSGAFAAWQLGTVRRGGALLLVFAGSLFVLFLLARALGYVLRKGLRQRGSFVLRTGMANVYRPRNQTSLLFITIGIVALIATVVLQLGSGLSEQIQFTLSDGRANTLLFDIQPSQRDAVREFLTESKLPILADAPVVTMRLTSLRGESVRELQKKPPGSIPAWTLRREYRSTYRESLVESETLVSGEWIPRWDLQRQPVPVSLEDGIAEKLGVKLGDSLEFDVQGVSVKAEVKSLRRVDWKRVQPNFFVVFPLGVIDAAPQFSVMATRTASPAEGAQFQRDLLQKFASISVIDATLILRTVDDVLARLMSITNALLFLVILSAAVILISVSVNSREVRRQDNLLLRVLGATSGQITQISLAEFAFIGVLASLAGAVLGVAAYNLFAWQVFELQASVHLGAAILVVLLVTLLTAIIGLVSALGTNRSAPLGDLRAS